MEINYIGIFIRIQGTTEYDTMSGFTVGVTMEKCTSAAFPPFDKPGNSRGVLGNRYFPWFPHWNEMWHSVGKPIAYTRAKDKIYQVLHA